MLLNLQKESHFFMLLQDRYVSANLIILSVTLWIVCIFLAFFIGTFSLYRLFSQKGTKLRRLQRINTFTWSISFILMSVVFLLFLVWYYFVDDPYISSFIDSLTVFIFHVALLIKIIDTEYTLHKYEVYKRYYFSFLFLALGVFAVIIPPPEIRTVFLYQIIYISLFMGGISIYIITFSYVAYKTEGKERNMALRLVIAPVLVISGIIFLPYNVEVYFKALLYYDFLYYVPQIIVAIGLVITFSTFYKNLTNEEETSG